MRPERLSRERARRPRSAISHHQLTRDVTAYSIALLAGRGLPLLALPLILRGLTPSSFGVAEASLSVAALVTMVAAFGLGEALVRFLPSSDPANRRALQSTAVRFTALTGTVGGAVLALAAPSLGRLLGGGSMTTAVLMILAGRLPFEVVSRVLQEVLRSQQKASRAASLSIVEAAVGIAAAVALVRAGTGPIGYVTGLALGTVASFATALRFVGLGPSSAVRRDALRTLCGYSWPLALQSIAVYGYLYFDRVLLARFGTPVDVAHYSVASKVTALPLLLAGAFSQAWHPYYLARLPGRTCHDLDAADTRLRKASLITLWGFGWVLVAQAAASPVLVVLLGGRAYSDAAVLVAPLSIAVAMQLLSEFTFMGLLLAKRSGLMACVRVASAVANLLGNLYLIPRFGALGAAWSTAGSLALMVIFSAALSTVVHPRPLPWARLAIVFATVAAAIHLAATPSFHPPRLLFAVASLAFGGFAALSPPLAPTSTERPDADCVLH